MTNRLWFFLEKFEAMYDEISTQSSFVLASPINTRGWWLHISDPEEEDNRKVGSLNLSEVRSADHSRIKLLQGMTLQKLLHLLTMGTMAK